MIQIEQLHSAEKIDDLVRVSADASRQRVVAREKLEVNCFRYYMEMN